MPLQITLKDSNKESKIQKDIKEESKFENNITNTIEDSKNNQLELLWKSFLDSNPSILIKLSNINKLPENASSAGSVLLANGMYEEAKLWKEFRKKEKVN